MLDSIYRNSIQLFSYRLLKVPKIIKTKFERTKKAQRVYPFNTNVIRTISFSDFYIIKGYDKNIAHSSKNNITKTLYSVQCKEPYNIYQQFNSRCGRAWRGRGSAEMESQHLLYMHYKNRLNFFHQFTISAAFYLTVDSKTFISFGQGLSIIHGRWGGGELILLFFYVFNALIIKTQVRF